MNQFRIYTRVNPESRETPFPLPVYVRSIGYKNMEKGYRERATELHSPFFEMIWCTHGIGEVILFQEAFQLFPNDVFFYYPNERHSFHALSEQWEVRWIAFDGPAATVFFEGYGYSRKMHAAGPCPLDLFEEIQTKIGDPSPVVFRSMPALLCRLLALAGGTAKTESDPVRNALEIIRENLTNPDLNVNFLADRLGIHRSTPVELFKTHLGTRPGQAIRNRRFHVAEAFLRGSNLPIREIAKRCGIPDVSSFCRFFQEKSGFTPTQYRRNEQEKMNSPHPDSDDLPPSPEDSPKTNGETD